MESLPPLPPGAVLDDSPSSLPPLPHGAMLDPPRAPDAPSLPSLPAGASLDPPPPPGATLDPPHPTPAPAPASTHGVGAPHPAPGNETLNVQPPGEPPIFLQEAYREIAKTPGLGKAGQLAVIGKHQARAFGPPPTPAEYAPTVSNPGVADKAVQAVNQFEKGYVLNKALPVMRRIPGLEETANRTEKFYNENYSSEPSVVNMLAEGTGDVASTVGLAGGPAASTAYQAISGGIQGGVRTYDAARQRGAPPGPAAAQAAVGAAVGAAPFPIARYGGAALSKALPASVASTAAGRVAAAIPAVYAEQVAVGAGQAGIENAIAKASYDPQRNPYEGIDRNLLISSIPGAVGFGLAAARKPGEQQQRSQPTEQPRQPVEAPTEPAQPQQNQPSQELLTRAPEAAPHEQSLPIVEKGTPDAPALRTDQESPRAQDADGRSPEQRSRNLQLQPQRQEEPGNGQQRVEAPGEVPAAQEKVKAPAPAEGQEAAAVQQPEQEAQAEGVAPATPAAPAAAPDGGSTVSVFGGKTSIGGEAPPSRIRGFRTELGSTYTLEGNTTQRTKTAHAGHDPADVGLKKPSEHTVYVDPEFAREVGMWNTSSNAGRRLMLRGDKVVLVSKNPGTGQMGRDVIHGDNTFKTEPAMGLSPLELWNKKEGDAWASNHPGNKIVQVHMAQEAPAEGPKLIPVADPDSLDRSQLAYDVSRDPPRPGRASPKMGEMMWFEPEDGSRPHDLHRDYVRVEAPAEAAPAEAAPPAGVFDRMENWARERLKEVEQRATENTAGMTAEQHKRLGSAGPLDPHRLVLYGVIGAAKIAKGAQRFVTWSKAMAEDLGEKFTGMRKVDQAYTWREARRIHRMSDADRADYVAEKYTVPQTETTKQTVRRLTGQVDTARATAEVEALHAKLRAAAQGAKEGYRAGVADLAAIKKDFAKTIRETLPPALHGDFLGEVSRVRTPGQMRVALTKASNLLADYELRGALGDVEKLTGTLKLDLPKAIRTPEVTEAQAAELAGAKKVEALKKKATGEDLRSIDLNTLAEPYRGEVRKLIGEAKGLKLRMQEIAQKGGTIEEKGRLVDDFERIDRSIRQQAADERATKELRVGKRIINRDSLVNEVVGKIDPKGEAAAVKPLTSEPSREVSLTRRIARAHASMETVATNILSRDSEAYKATIDNVRRGQEGYHDERRRFHQHMSKAFEAAGIEPGSKKLNDWLNTRETVELPGGRLATLTRNEMVGLMASYGDPQTAALVDRGVKWTSRNNPRDAGFKLSPGDFSAINAKLSDGERSLIDAFKGYNSKEITARAMATKLDLSGWAPDPHEGYYPRARNRKQLEDAGLPEGWRGMRRRALENVSSMKERAPDLATPLFVPEFLQDTSRYVDDTARLLHLAEPVRTVASLWEHPKVAQAVQHRYGESMNRRVQRFLEDTMQVQVKPPDNGPGKITAALARNVSRAWLQLNPSPVAKNVIGGTISLLPEFEARDLSAGVAKMFSPKAYQEMINNSGVAWDRYEGQGLYGQVSPLTEKRVESVARMTLPEAVKAMKPGAAVDALPFMRWADSVPLRVAWEASKSWADRTMPEAAPEARRQEALDKFHDSIYRTQNGSSSTEIADAGSVARRQPAYLPWLMFQSDNLKKANLLMQMKSANAKTRSKILLAVGLNALASGAIGYGLKRGATEAGRAVTGAEPNPDDREKLNSGFWWDTARGLVGVSPIASAVTDLARAAMRPNPDAKLNNPVTESVADFATSFLRMVHDAYTWAEKEADTPERDAAFKRLLLGGERLLLGAGTLSGVPLVPPYKLARRGVVAANYQPEDPRLQKNREDTKARTEVSKQLRQQTPNLRKLLDERNELDRKGGLGDKNLTSAERERKNYLDGASRVYDRHLQAIQKAKAASDTGAVERLKDSLRRAVSDPDRLEVEREMTALRAKRTAAAEARKEKRLSDAYRAFNGTDQYRLNRLENVEKMIHQTEDKLGKGEITPQEAERRTRSLVGSVKKRAA